MNPTDGGSGMTAYGLLASAGSFLTMLWRTLTTGEQEAEGNGDGQGTREAFDRAGRAPTREEVESRRAALTVEVEALIAKATIQLEEQAASAEQYRKSKSDLDGLQKKIEHMPANVNDGRRKVHNWFVTGRCRGH